MDMTVYFRVNHAGAEDFQPSGILANPASLPFTYDTGDIHFSARFGKGEKAGTQAYSDILAEKLIHENSQYTLKVAECDTLCPP